MSSFKVPDVHVPLLLLFTASTSAHRTYNMITSLSAKNGK